MTMKHRNGDEQNLQGADPAERVGKALRKIRKEKGYSLEQLAQMTGVSKPMLSQIERGISVPTVTVLWKIAGSLHTPFSCFLEEPQAQYQISAVHDAPWIEEEDGAMRARTLFGYDPLLSSESFYIEFDPGTHHRSVPHENGVEEMIFVSRGTLEMDLAGKREVLHEKEAIRFRADCDHAYINPGKEICEVCDVIFYPAR